MKVKLTDVAKAFHITVDTINARRMRCWNWSAILTTPLRLVDLVPIMILPEPRPVTYHAIAKDFGIPSGTLVSRLNKGWDWQRALTTPTRNKREKTNAT